MIDRVVRRPVRARLIHTARVALVIGLLLALPAPSQQLKFDGAAAPEVDLPQFDLAGDGLKIEPGQDANGMWRVVDEEERMVALVARTLPAAADVVGYRGPTEASLVLESDLSIRGVSLLSSADTQEHVDAVLQDRRFFQQFIGWPWGGPSEQVEIDAVSGATLTSLALAEGVLKRIGGARPSLVFQDAVQVSEVTDWFPDGVTVSDETGEVRTRRGSVIGRVMRSGPLVDDVIGYQGPTELLMKISADGIVDSIRLRSSFDNEPYVDYVRVEKAFWKIFEGRSQSELARFDPQEARVEGVSGATMTSLAVADTIVAASKAAQRISTAPKSSPPKWWGSIRWTRADVAMVSLLIAVGLLRGRHWFHVGWTRRLWLLSVIALIGLWSGNLISMALIAGWSAEGVAWRLAPGLAALVVITLLAPPLAKANPYCDHLCPHGAIQQLIKPGSRSQRKKTLPPKVYRWLSLVPGASLVAAYVSLMMIPSLDLSAWEPFHAYLFRIAPWGSIALALLSLVFAAVIPMGYCRFGCPTGRLIDYLRRTAISDRIELGDWTAGCLLLVALTIRHFGN